MKVALRHA